MVHAWLGRHVPAILQQQLALADVAASSDHPSVAIRLGNLATSYFEAGQFVAAVTLFATPSENVSRQFEQS